MDFRRRPIKPLGRFITGTARARGNGNGNGHTADAIDWTTWLRFVERKRRLASHRDIPRPKPLPDAYFVLATFGSFRLEGLDVTETEVNSALHRVAKGHSLSSRQTQRLRNHAAILHRIESSIRLGQPLRPPAVLRWYTSISAGLSTTGLADAEADRLDAVVRRLNSPQLRLQPAMTEMARLHIELLADPLVPSFNGILARLLLRYHLARCGLPPVVFDPESDGECLSSESFLLSRMLEMIDASYNLILELPEA